MKNFLKYAWSKRNKLWRKRDVIIKKIGRQTIRVQYRASGLFTSLVCKDTLTRHGDSHELLKAANPFIEYEVGRLRFKSAPIATTIRETYAQCNEDLIVESLHRAKFSINGRDMSTVRYLEVGGNHPVQTSSTLLALPCMWC